jgi:hypothetical protein
VLSKPNSHSNLHRVIVPEMLFGHLLTGSNFDDDEKRVTGETYLNEIKCRVEVGANS